MSIENSEPSKKRLEELTQLVVATLKEQALRPPGNDSCIGAFYQAVYLQFGENIPAVRELIRGIQMKREMPASFHVNLLFRAIQYELINLDNYPQHYMDEDQAVNVKRWQSKIMELLHNDMSNKRIHEILLKRNTVTNQSARYFGPRFVLSTLAAKKPEKILSYVDLGCSCNQGAIRVVHGEFDIIDTSPNQTISKLIQSKPQIDAIGVDIEDPTKSDFFQFFIACTWYPNELLVARPHGVTAKNLSPRAENVRFKKANVIDLPIHTDHEISPGTKDVVSMNTILYQLPPEDRTKVIRNALELIHEDGVVIIQDFTKPDPKSHYGFGMRDDWGAPGSYRMLALRKYSTTAMEVLIYDGGRCKTVSEGKDYVEFMNLIA